MNPKNIEQYVVKSVLAYLGYEEEVKREIKRVKTKKDYYKKILDTLCEIEEVGYDKCRQEGCYEYCLEGSEDTYVSNEDEFKRCDKCRKYYCKLHIGCYCVENSVGDSDEDSDDEDYDILCESCLSKGGILRMEYIPKRQ